MKKASIKSIVGKHAKTAKSKYDTTRNYSSFWMDKSWGSTDKFSGLAAGSKGTSDVIKAIKLAGYHRAIGNFAKILTKKDIKLVFQGNQSYTDGKTISLSADIKDANFDLHVALALHESAHCIMTDFDATTQVRMDTGHMKWQTLFPLINWIEDRRIDQFVFSTSPGYRAYYHKLYDTYFVADAITKALKSRKFRDATLWESWEMRIINCLNPAADPNAMPGLKQVLDLIDVANIARLKTTKDVIELAQQVHDMISITMEEAEKEQEQKENEGDPQDEQPKGKGGEGQGSGEKSEDEDDNDEDGDGNSGGEDGDDDESGEDSGEGEGETLEDLTNAQMREAIEQLQKQKDLGEGRVGERKEGTKNLQRKVQSLTQAAAEIQQVGGDDSIQSFTAVTYDLTKNGRIFMEYMALLGSSVPEDRQRVYSHILNEALGSYFYKGHSAGKDKAVQAGFNQGAMLGRKLQLRNEERELVTNRLRTGGLDAKRIAHAGYGVENIFKQIHVDKYKGVNLHISLDASGSMGGDKWEQTSSMTIAIAKAARHCTNMHVQVSLRHTANDKLSSPVIITVYDSRINPLQQLMQALALTSTCSVTPEGLCFEAQYKRNMFVPSSTNCDSYFINFSDGAPGGTGNYYGESASRHTRKYMQLLENQLGMKIISFFIEYGSYGDNNRKPVVKDYFAGMYGAKNSFAVNAQDMLGIARTLNSKFLAPSAKA